MSPNCTISISANRSAGATSTTSATELAPHSSRIRDVDRTMVPPTNLSEFSLGRDVVGLVLELRGDDRGDGDRRGGQDRHDDHGLGDLAPFVAIGPDACD